MVLCDIPLLGDVKVLKVGLKEYSLVLDGDSVALQHLIEVHLLLLTHVEVVSPSGESGCLIELGYLAEWVLLQSLDSEDSVNLITEHTVVELPILNLVQLIIIHEESHLALIQI